MTSTITNFSALIDTTYPIPGVDNDTQGFRDNYIQIKRSFDTTAGEITNLQISQYEVNTRLNNATVVGDNYAALIASTVTTLVLNSLTNNSPDIVTPIVRTWYNTTITNDITTLENTLTSTTLNLQSQITSSNQNIAALQTSTNSLTTTSTTLWNNVAQLTTAQNTLTNRVVVLENQMVLVENTATEAWENMDILINSSAQMQNNISSLQTTSTTLWNATYGAGGTLANISSINSDISNIELTAINTGTAIANLQTTVSGLPSFRSSNPPVLSAKGTTGDKAGMIWADANYIYVCLAAYNGVSNIWVRSATTSSW
jgi:hypothetical protein